MASLLRAGARLQAVSTQHDEQPPLPRLLGRCSRPEKDAKSIQQKDQWKTLVHSPSAESDIYPASLWNSLEKYLENLARLVRSTTSHSESGCLNAPSVDAPHVFRGGCEGMATELLQRRLPFLENLRLEQICQIVQLAFKKQLLVEQDGLLVPSAVHAASRNAHVEALAKQPKQPNVQNGSCRVVQTQGELCHVVWEVLVKNGGGLDLSQLKVKILETMNVAVSESLFGCTKLLDLMRLPALTQLCDLQKESGRTAYRITLREPKSHQDFSKAMMSGQVGAALPQGSAGHFPVGQLPCSSGTQMPPSHFFATAPPLPAFACHSSLGGLPFLPPPGLELEATGTERMGSFGMQPPPGLFTQPKSAGLQGPSPPGLAAPHSGCPSLPNARDAPATAAHILPPPGLEAYGVSPHFLRSNEDWKIEK